MSLCNPRQAARPPAVGGGRAGGHLLCFFRYSMRLLRLLSSFMRPRVVEKSFLCSFRCAVSWVTRAVSCAAHPRASEPVHVPRGWGPSGAHRIARRRRRSRCICVQLVEWPVLLQVHVGLTAGRLVGPEPTSVQAWKRARFSARPQDCPAAGCRRRHAPSAVVQ